MDGKDGALSGALWIESCSLAVEKPHIDSPSVHSYLQILQSSITRMATNSTSCKTWCVTVVSATIVLLLQKDKPEYIFIALFPTLLFAFLDAYYLGLERCFRLLYNEFIGKLHNDTIQSSDLYILRSHTGVYSTMTATSKALASISVWPFYGLIMFMLVIVWLFFAGESFIHL